ncbi:uncharacterized protein B0I36DRAFT_346790 [Microdochium trichocladiopsis]|uniref:Uncharacterized protein n=1 Tax=Microdochium trichocladiopsis TaxID=1682393 RepID=A0A9P9BQI4_9PEZI|nr:uncharacterized protein B0I36DRAFT_346790 [Microdochium trichocladiopsis]KAH7034918.1 hypothetical protein B0I36DRAFT_346790 [Microdochium trichocladiopsis]
MAPPLRLPCLVSCAVHASSATASCRLVESKVFCTLRGTRTSWRVGQPMAKFFTCTLQSVSVCCNRTSREPGRAIGSEDILFRPIAQREAFEIRCDAHAPFMKVHWLL